MGGTQTEQPMFVEVGVERCQHAVCPDDAVRPVQDGRRLSGRCSRERHCGRLLVRSYGHSTFTFLRPFAPPALPGFFATMDALTPVRLVLGTRVTARGGFTAPERPSVIRTGIPVSSHRTFRPFRLQPPPAVPMHCLTVSDIGLTGGFVLRTNRALSGRASFGLRRWGAGSPQQEAESSLRRLTSVSRYYGLVVRRRLLPTPPRGDAVTIGYRDARRSPARTCTSRMQRTYRRTPLPACPAGEAVRSPARREGAAYHADRGREERLSSLLPTPIRAPSELGVSALSK